MRSLFLFLTILVLLAACVSSDTNTPIGCQPSKIQQSQISFLEIKGDMKSEGEMWALLFFEKAYVNEEVKIVWRITGEGEKFSAQAQDEAGTVLQPIWTEYHGGSNWERPGQEWGTGFNFPTSGCWIITVTRGKTTGTIALEVLEPP